MEFISLRGKNSLANISSELVVLGSPIHTNPWTQFLINIVSCSVTQSL
jgi:hypothetical protein